MKIDIPEYMPDWIKQHIQLYLENPEKAHLWDSSLGGGSGLLHTLLLITRGRKSGELRPLPLIYGEDNGNYIVIASKGGSPDHPAWYLNLQSTPECEIRVGTKRMNALARSADAHERQHLWEKMAKLYPPYDDYQQAAGVREIP
ncbi:nitroreductase/quinone reductase family protein, partial [Litorivivens sp.]